MSRVEAIVRESIRVKEAFLAGDGPAIVEGMADTIIGALRSGKRLYLCGNGGSAADAQHIAGEFIGRFLIERAPVPCVALTTDTSVLTCLSNDYAFDIVFERQVAALMEAGDVLLAISTSGNSPNVLKAVAAARELGGKVLGFAGSGGGRLAEAADLCVVAETEGSPRAQELHITALHALCELVEKGCFGDA
jgi:D-sedoheptulose 7-phosphate isomerase